MRPLAEETRTRHRTGETVRTKLASIAKRAGQDKAATFCSLAHLICKGTLREAFRRLSRGAAPGLDGVTKRSYEEQLEENLSDLQNKLKRGSYQPKPVRRTYIPKAGSDKMRPLGIPALEDKLVQTALVIILESIYEQDFLKHSYGFRPQRNPHQALKELSRVIGTRRVGYVVDADIQGFFNEVNHEWLMKMLELRIKDTQIRRLIKRFLKAGIMESGNVVKSEEGVPQGGSLSPLLANIYLHYTLDLWFTKAVKKHCRGEAYIVRYADDFVACFQYKHDAEMFYEALRTRLAKFNLQVAEEKTKILTFGRFTARDEKKVSGRKPETFDFLGFTHYCGRSRRGRFKLKWKTARKKYHTRIQEFKEWIQENRKLPLSEIWKIVNSKLRGHYQYYGVRDNWNQLLAYRRHIIKLLHKWLNRRSQRSKLTWVKFSRMLRYYPLVEPKSLINLNSAFV